MSLWRRELPTALISDGCAAGGERRTGTQRADAIAASFDTWLDGQALRSGTRVACVLGGDAVRHMVVPWVAELSTETQRQRLAEQTFREAFGDVASGWTVRQHIQSYGAAALACATETVLLDRLDALALARGVILRSVQSSLVHAFNAAQRRLGSDLCWFVLAETQWTSVLLISPQEVLRFARVPAAGSALAVLLKREWFALGIEAAHPPVYVAGQAATTLVAGSGPQGTPDSWRFVVLDADPELRAGPAAPWSQAA